MTNTLTIGDAARRIGVSPTWLRTLDAELRPERTPSGQRRYDLHVVEAYAEQRAAKRAARRVRAGV